MKRRNFFIAILVAAALFLIVGFIFDKAHAYGARSPEMKEVCRTEFGQRRPCTDTDFRIKAYP